MLYQNKVNIFKAYIKGFSCLGKLRLQFEKLTLNTVTVHYDKTFRWKLIIGPLSKDYSFVHYCTIPRFEDKCRIRNSYPHTTCLAIIKMAFTKLKWHRLVLRFNVVYAYPFILKSIYSKEGLRQDMSPFKQLI